MTRHYGPRKRTRIAQRRTAQSLLLNARDLDRITPEMLVRCHGIPTVAEADAMLSAEKARRDG